MRIVGETEKLSRLFSKVQIGHFWVVFDIYEMTPHAVIFLSFHSLSIEQSSTVAAFEGLLLQQRFSLVKEDSIYSNSFDSSSVSHNSKNI